MYYILLLHGCLEIRVFGNPGLGRDGSCVYVALQLDGKFASKRPAKRNTGSAGAGVLRLARGSVRARTGGGGIYHSSSELAAREVALVVLHELLVVALAGGDFRGAK